MVQIVVRKDLTMNYRDLGRSGSTKNSYIGVYCCIAVWFVIERFWETNFCAEYICMRVWVRDDRKARVVQRCKTIDIRENVVKRECNDCILLPFMPRVTLKCDVLLLYIRCNS